MFGISALKEAVASLATHLRSLGETIREANTLLREQCRLDIRQPDVIDQPAALPEPEANGRKRGKAAV